MSEKINLVKLWGNNEKRLSFLNAYEDWGVWLTIPELDLTFHRYELPDKTYIIAMQHKANTYSGYDKGYKWVDSVRYYIQKTNEPFTPNSHSGINTVADLLKDAKVALQKKGGK